MSSESPALTSRRSSAPPAAYLPSRGRGSAVHRASPESSRTAWPEHRPRERPPHPARLAIGRVVVGIPPAGSAAVAHMVQAATVPVVMRMPPAGPAAVAHRVRTADLREAMRMFPAGSVAGPYMAPTDNRTGRTAVGTDSTDFRSRDCRNSRSTGHRFRYTDRKHSRPAKPRSATAPAVLKCVARHPLPHPAATAEMITWAKA